MVNIRKREKRGKERTSNCRCFSSPSCLSLSPPKQQFFNCAIVEIIFPCLALRCPVPTVPLPYASCKGYCLTVHRHLYRKTLLHLILLTYVQNSFFSWILCEKIGKRLRNYVFCNYCVRVSFSHVQNSYNRHQYHRFHYESVCENMSSATLFGGTHFFVRRTHVFYHQYSHNNYDYGCENMCSAIFCCRIHFQICRTLAFTMISSTKTMNTSGKIWVRPFCYVELKFIRWELNYFPCTLPPKIWIRLRKYEFCNSLMLNSFSHVQHSLNLAEYGSFFCE